MSETAAIKHKCLACNSNNGQQLAIFSSLPSKYEKGCSEVILIFWVNLAKTVTRKQKALASFQV